MKDKQRLYCKTCAWWKGPYRDARVEKGDKEYGFCHFHPPTVGDREGPDRTFWPITMSTDWCASHSDRCPERIDGVLDHVTIEGPAPGRPGGSRLTRTKTITIHCPHCCYHVTYARHPRPELDFGGVEAEELMRNHLEKDHEQEPQAAKHLGPDR